MSVTHFSLGQPGYDACCRELGLQPLFAGPGEGFYVYLYARTPTH